MSVLPELTATADMASISEPSPTLNCAEKVRAELKIPAQDAKIPIITNTVMVTLLELMPE